MSDFMWKKRERLTEQLKFFGAKKQQFISIYAKKPRILMRNKIETGDPRVDALRQDRMVALYHHQLMRGMQSSSLGCSQMYQASMSGIVGSGGGRSGAGFSAIGGII